VPEVRATLVVPAPQLAVWDYIVDLRNAPRWMWGVREVLGPARHPLRPGDHIRLRLIAGGRAADSEWTIGDWAPPHRLESEGSALGARAWLWIECRAVGPQRTEVEHRLRYELPGGPLGRLAAHFGIHGVLELQARNSLRALARELLGASRAVPADAMAEGR